MIFTETENKNEYTLSAETFRDRIRLAWYCIAYPNRLQIRATLTEGSDWIIKNCRPIMNNTKNLTKVRE